MDVQAESVLIRKKLLLSGHERIRIKIEGASSYRDERVEPSPKQKSRSRSRWASRWTDRKMAVE